MKKSYAYALLTVFIWSTMATVTKIMLVDIPSLEALSVSSYLGAVFLLFMNLKNKNIIKMRNCSMKDYAVIAGLGFIGMFLCNVLYYYSLTQLTAQEACIVNHLWPIMLVIFSCIILKEKMTAMKGFALLCSFAGIILLTAGNSGSSERNLYMGFLSCIISAACYGLFSVLNKKVDYDQNISMMIIWLVTAVCAMVSGLMTEEWVPIAGVQWLGMIWLGVMNNAVAFLLWALALKNSENTAVIANMAFLTPFMSVVISAVVLKERLQVNAFGALVLIIGGILLQSIFDNRSRQ